jgi:tetratricopeptide (TPR) repeat protein
MITTTRRLSLQLTLGVLLWLSPAYLLAQTQELFHGHIQRGLDLTYRAEYEAALEEFDAALALDTIDPAGYLFKAACLETYMVDYDSRCFEEEFYALIDLCQRKAEARLKIVPEDGWSRFYLGTCHAYRAVHDIFYKGSYLSGVSHGFKTIREFEQALREDSTVYDAYLGIGIFDWGLDKVVSKLPLVNRSSDEAVDRVTLAFERGVYSRVPAKSVLAWMHVIDERYDQALVHARELCENFPQSRFFKVILGSIYLDLEEWDPALEVWWDLFELATFDSLAFYPRAVARLGLARSYFGKGDFERCIEMCSEALGAERPDPMNRRLKADLEELETLKRKAEKELEVYN